MRPAVPSLIALYLAGCSPSPHSPPLIPTAACPAFADMSRGLPVSQGWRTNPALADLDDDGDLDLAATTRKGVGPRVFLFVPPDRWEDASEGISLGHYPCGIGMRLTDVDGDGRADLIVADHCTGLHIFRRGAAGAWERTAHLQHPSREGFNDAAAADIDGDGRIDLVALAAFATGLSLFLQEAPGRFVHHPADLPRAGNGFEVHVTDLDGDGRADIFSTLQGQDPSARDGGGRMPKVWLQRSNGVWEKGGGLPEHGNYYGIAAGDIDRDGRPDLALSSRDSGQGITIYLGAGQGVWRQARGEPPGASPERAFAGVALHDLDGDGNLDLAAVERLRPGILIWRGDGGGRFTECPAVADPPLPSQRPGWGLAVGDINRDGRPDLVAGFGSESAGALRAWIQIDRAP